MIFIQIFVVSSKMHIFSGLEYISAIQGHPRSILVPIESAYGMRFPICPSL